MGFKVLIVDDDPVFRAIAREILSPWFDCLDADDGDAALVQLSEHSIDLIVTDILMARVDGLQLIRQARLRTKYVPIIAVSGGGPGLDAEMLLDMADMLGVDGLARKPLSRVPFLKLVAQVLNTKAST